MKNVSRNKFLLCCRPVVDMDRVLESKVVGRSVSDRNIRYNAVQNKEDMKVSASKSSLSDNGCLESSERSIHYPPKRTFSRVIKAVLFETILAKRVRDKKIGQDSHGSKRSNSTRFLDLSDNESVHQVSVDSKIQEIKTNSALSSSSSFRSSSSSSSSSSSLSEPKGISKALSDVKNPIIDAKQNHKSQQDQAMKPRNMDMGQGYSSIYLLLISLTITIFWGRLCAILFTSIWLYFLLGGNAGDSRPEKVMIRVAETESRDYKKRVIMEGLLKRKSTQRPEGIKFLT